MGPALRPSAFLLAMAAAGPLAAQTIKVEANDKVDFAAFRSFAWKDTQEPAPRPLDHLQITRVVERELEAKGLAKARQGEPDVVVRYFAKIEKRTRGTGRSEDQWRTKRSRRRRATAGSG